MLHWVYMDLAIALAVFAVTLLLENLMSYICLLRIWLSLTCPTVFLLASCLILAADESVHFKGVAMKEHDQGLYIPASSLLGNFCLESQKRLFHLFFIKVWFCV